MKNVAFLLITLTTVSLMISCEKEEADDNKTVIGLVQIITKPLELDPFVDIELNGVANLYVTVGSSQSVVLKAQQNIIDILTWEVIGGTLFIGIDEDIYLQNHEEIRFEIAIPDLESLIHDGVGDITLDGDRRDVFDIDYRGVGHIFAYELPMDQCVVSTSGAGDCKVQVDHTLEVDISGVGYVYYRGHPQITVNDQGVGNLVNDN